MFQSELQVAGEVKNITQNEKIKVKASKKAVQSEVRISQREEEDHPLKSSKLLIKHKPIRQEGEKSPKQSRVLKIPNLIMANGAGPSQFPSITTLALQH